MIIGIGCDLCQISRMEALLADTAFLQRYFAPQEQAYIKGRGLGAAASMAACFAAKEALVKALGCGFSGIRLEDICVLHQENGAPYYLLLDTAFAAAQQVGVSNSHLSISHDGGQALAFCVLEG